MGGLSSIRAGFEVDLRGKRGGVSGLRAQTGPGTAGRSRGVGCKRPHSGLNHRPFQAQWHAISDRMANGCPFRWRSTWQRFTVEMGRTRRP